ncbi:glycosyltransferase family 4 protein [Eisenbergiella sp.]
MKKILIIMGRYLPGYKDGGPIRSTKNLVDQLGDEYDIRVACYDRDAGDAEQYPDIRLYEWNPVGKGLVYYIPEYGFTNAILIELAQEVDLLYLWGCFNKYTLRVVMLKRMKKIHIPVVIASMGLFSPLAFKIKYAKKKLLVTFMNLISGFADVYWSATSQMEVDEIKNQVRVRDDHIFIAEDLPRKVELTPIHKEKSPGVLKVVWISRIARKKNLIGAIEMLRAVQSQVTFTIYGPVFDTAYWNECQELLDRLPQNITWCYEGDVVSEQVVETLKQHHVFLFPTLGENYGHVVQEALSAGCPCILSDQTPWQTLEEHNAGYVYSLKEIKSFADAIEMYAAMDETKFHLCVESAHQFAIENSNSRVLDTGYRKIFDNDLK